jgi:hypothetical protein
MLVKEKKTEPTLLSFAGHVFDVLFLLVARDQKKREKKNMSLSLVLLLPVVVVRMMIVVRL